MDDLVLRATIQDELSRPLGDIRADIRGLRSDVQGLGSSTRTSSRDVDGLGRSSERAARKIKLADTHVASMVKRVGRWGLAGAVGLLGTTLTKGFQRLDSIDSARAKLDGLGHSTRTIDKIMKNALASVKGTAFGLDEAASVSASAVAAGIKPGRELTKTLKLVADSATIGSTSMGEMGAIWNKVAASNKIQGEVINQLQDRGIPIVQLLGKELGKTSEEVLQLTSKGEVNFRTFSKAMERGLGGAALKSGDTFAGAWKNMWASVGRIGANLLAGVFPEAKSGLAGITEQLGKLEEKAKPAGAAIGQVIRDFKEGNGTAGEIKRGLGDIVSVLKTFYGLVKAIPGPVKKYAVQIILATIAIRKLNAVVGFGEKGLITWAKSALNAETRAGTFRRGVQQLAGAGGLALLLNSTQQTSREMGTLQGALGGAMAGAALGSSIMPGLGTAIGGVAGLVGGGIIGNLTAMGNATKAGADIANTATPKWESYAETLSGVAANITKATRAMVIQNLEKEGGFDVLRGIGIKDGTAVEAYLHDGKARQIVQGKLTREITAQNLAIKTQEQLIANAIKQYGENTDIVDNLKTEKALLELSRNRFQQAKDRLGLVQADVKLQQHRNALMRDYGSVASLVAKGISRRNARSIKAGDVSASPESIAGFIAKNGVQNAAEIPAIVKATGLKPTAKVLGEIQGHLTKLKKDPPPDIKAKYGGIEQAKTAVLGLINLLRILNGEPIDPGSPQVGPKAGVGDTRTSRGRGRGNLTATLSKHDLINRSLGGRYKVSNALIGGGGLGRGSGDHQDGRALDVVGPNLPAYASAVRDAGGYAAIHGDHVHSVMGDTASSRSGRSAGSSSGTVIQFGEGAIQVIVTNPASNVDVKGAVREAWWEIQRELEEAND